MIEKFLLVLLMVLTEVKPDHPLPPQCYIADYIAEYCRDPKSVSQMCQDAYKGMLNMTYHFWWSTSISSAFGAHINVVEEFSLRTFFVSSKG